MSGLRLVNVSKSFGSFTAIDNLDLDVKDGEFITLLGPSGCGKTTTLRTVAGFAAPDTGEIYIKDRRVNDVPPSRRNTGMCFQSYALFPHMTVFDNVRFGLRMRRVPLKEQRRRVEEALAMVELEQLARRKPSELSGGQQQRVALARAIVIHPDVLLFDEPLSNLDAKLRESVRVEIRALQKRLGITSVYVTHDQAEALVISDRVVVMRGGRIEQVGDPLQVYEHPATSFVAGFIGLANIGRGTVTGSDGINLTVKSDFGELVMRGPAMPVNSTVIFCFRPEDVVLAGEGERNRVRGRVEQQIFMGNLTDLFVDVEGKVLRAQTHRRGNLRVGDPVELAIPEEALRVLEREGDA